MTLDMERIQRFCSDNKISSKGRLSIMLQINRRFSTMSFPIEYSTLLTTGGGQISKMSGANCQKILAKYGITRILASEAGRTSRGGLGYVQAYTDLINDMHPTVEEFEVIERFWVDRIIEYFASQPFRLSADSSISVSAAVETLLTQAAKRQEEQPGATIVGTVLQHLVAAKLSIIMPDVDINGASVADAPTDRDGDFNIGDTVIHCTTAPGEPLMRKCLNNLSAGLHPTIITVRDRVKNAYDLASDFGFINRIEVWDVQSFLSTNVQEHGRFTGSSRHEILTHIVDRYNEIIDKYETDPGLKIAY